MQLLIRPVIEQAVALSERVRVELPTHEGLHRATVMLSDAAKGAERVAASMKRPFSPHRLPVVFLTLALVGVLTVLYWRFFHVSTLTIALPDRDAAELRERATSNPRLNVSIHEVPGSREAAAMLTQGTVDLGFIQGGIPVPPRLLRLEAPSRELVLYFVRDGHESPSGVHTVLTSVEGEGSHAVAQDFFEAWGHRVTYVHLWKEVTHDPHFAIPAEVDAVFVVKDLSDEQTLIGAERLLQAGFHLLAPALGARAARYDYLQPVTVKRGDLQPSPEVPAVDLPTYSVTTYLVAREGLTPSRLTQAAHLLDPNAGSIVDGSFQLSSTEASELFQGVDAFFSILVNIGLAFLALLGLDVIAYRKQFHELNSLISLISLLQSNKDVLGVVDDKRRENQLYLSLCSDALSLISSIGGYYTQENSSLLFNNLSEVVHQRCDSLKINIQLKLLHALVD